MLVCFKPFHHQSLSQSTSGSDGIEHLILLADMESPWPSCWQGKRLFLLLTAATDLSAQAQPNQDGYDSLSQNWIEFFREQQWGSTWSIYHWFRHWPVMDRARPLAIMVALGQEVQLIRDGLTQGSVSPLMPLPVGLQGHEPIQHRQPHWWLKQTTIISLSSLDYRRDLAEKLLLFCPP
jgi:hypothetical protein